MVYHRILSPNLHIPTDPKVPVPVGLLACQRDPLLRQIQTHVVSASVLQQIPAAAKGKKGNKAVVAPTLPDVPILQVVLQDTVIFPEGGGQPTDTGILITDVEWPVIQCKRHGGIAVHYVPVSSSDTDAALRLFHEGRSVVARLDEAGFERRYDHMSIHTSQHLLSALLETHLQLPTLSWSLTSSPSPCYVEIPRSIKPDEVAFIQREANRLVCEGHQVHIEVEEHDPSQETGVQKLDDGRAIGKALPEDYTGGVKRFVVIEGVDKNPCCGTHLPSLNNLQLFLLPHTETMARSSTSTARLYFLSGPRLITYLTSAHGYLTETASMLSCGAPLVPERVSQTISERKKTQKRVDDLEQELAATIAKDLFTETLTTPQDKIWLKHLHRTDDSENPLSFLSLIVSVFAEKASANSIKYLLIMTSSPSVQTASTTTVVYINGSDSDYVQSLGKKFKAELEMKGGGPGTRWSGKFTGVWKPEQQGAAMANLLHAIGAEE